MQDLTTGPITRHLLKTTGFMLVTMLFQTLYFLVDLYWVGRLGTAAVAAVGIAGNLTFIVLALTQMLGVGTTAMVSHAVGRKDHVGAITLFNQSQVLAMITGVAFLIVGWVTGRAFGVAGAAASSLVAVAVGIVWLTPYFLTKESFLRFHVDQWKPRFSVWKQMLAIGLPAGFEFGITAVYLALVYSI